MSKELHPIFKNIFESIPGYDAWKTDNQDDEQDRLERQERYEQDPDDARDLDWDRGNQ